MSDKKYVVPEGMLNSLRGPYLERCHRGLTQNEMDLTRSMLEAALRWQSENPIVPTHEQFIDMCHEVMNDHDRKYSNSVSGPKAIEEWQRRMFLAPDPEVPEKETGTMVTPRARLEFCATLSRRVIVKNNGTGMIRVSLCGGAMLIESLPTESPTEPEVPEAVKDLLANTTNADLAQSQIDHHRWINEQIIEAYRRGQNSNK